MKTSTQPTQTPQEPSKEDGQGVDSQPAATMAGDAIAIDSMDEMMAHFMKWHHQGVRTMEQFLQIPQGVEMEINHGEKREQIVLKDNLHKGFIAGVEAALQVFGKLPFAIDVSSASQKSPESKE